MNRSLLTIVLFVSLGSDVATAQEATEHWPRFRGPNADGVAADDPRLPSTWNTTENVRWVADVPGWGWSCPVVWGDKVLLTTVVSDAENTAPQKGLYLTGATGDISLKDDETSSEFIAWFQPKAGPYNPSPIVYQGHYYT